MTYHPYMPAPGGICAVCQGPAMSPQHVVGYIEPAAATPSPAPAPQVAPEPTQATAPIPASEPVPVVTPAPDATTTLVQGELIDPEDQTPDERAEVSRLASTVELAFPAVGFIDPAAELEKLLRIVQGMPQDLKVAYPDKIRAAILAHEAGKGPEVSDEDLALAIFIQRTVATPLTEEELEAKATGRKTRTSADAVKKVPKSKQSSADQLKAMF